MIEAGPLDPVLSIQHLTVRTRGGRTILRDVSLDVPRQMITAIIGPSGAGKSTLLRCMNRLIDLDDNLIVEGGILFEQMNTRDRSVDADDLRRRIGIVFQQPVVFHGSIRRNVLFAATRIGIAGSASEKEALLEETLTQAGLWLEVRDRLEESAATLSIGQQQRLAIARTLAGKPDLILMDEPTSALDPASTAAIEETITSLKSSKSIVLVTHHLEQAKRLADWVACLCPKDGAGELLEADRCSVIFCCPTREETSEFLRAVR